MILQIYSTAGLRRVNYRRVHRRSGHSIRLMKEAASLAEDCTKVEDYRMAVDCCLFPVMNLRSGFHCSARCFRECRCRDGHYLWVDYSARLAESTLTAAGTGRIAAGRFVSRCDQMSL